MTIVILGLSITSSWGNGHASTYRALVRGLASRGHDVLFLERDAPWYAANRDLPRPPYCRVDLYAGLEPLARRHRTAIQSADLVIVGSYVPEGAAVIDWVLGNARGVVAFYDIDTPVTLAKLDAGDQPYIERRQISRLDIYLSFTGGPTLDRLEADFGARMARPLYCSVDADVYAPAANTTIEEDLNYLGTYSDDRQPVLEALLLEPARRLPTRRFTVAGAQYPATVAFPGNVRRVVHLAPRDHPAFYRRARFTLNVTRRDMVAAGFSPSVRLFEAAACGTPIVSDRWPGLDALFVPGREILLADRADEVLAYLREMSEGERSAIGDAGRRRVLAAHTGRHRAIELEGYVGEARGELPVTEPDEFARPA